jgi:hypothetical protein
MINVGGNANQREVKTRFRMSTLRKNAPCLCRDRDFRVVFAAFPLNRNIMTLKPTRADYVALLSSLGVDIPTRTKLSDAALKERLQKSLDASQQLPLVVPRGTIDPSIQPSWSRSSGSVEEAIGRVNIAEGLANMMARAQGRENADDLGTNPFSDVRQTLLALGKYWDMENRSYIMQDEEQTSAIPMRVRCTVCPVFVIP